MNISTGSVQDTILVYENKSGGLATKSGSLIYQHNDVYSQGTGNNQINEAWNDARSLAAGANEILDLSGVLKDDFGDTVAFTAIKDIMIENTSPTESLTVGNTGSNPWVGPGIGATANVVIPPKGKFHVSAPLAGWPVVAATGDQLKILNSGGAVTNYNISLLGVQ